MKAHLHVLCKLNQVAGLRHGHFLRENWREGGGREYNDINGHLKRLSWLSGVCGCVVMQLGFAGVLESMHALFGAAEGGTSLLCLGGSTVIHRQHCFLLGLRKGDDGHVGPKQKDLDSETSSR